MSLIFNWFSEFTIVRGSFFPQAVFCVFSVDLQVLHSPLIIWSFKRELRKKLLLPFNGLFSRTTWVSRYQKGKTNLDFTGARDSEWQWHQLGHMQVCTSLQTDNHASTPPLRNWGRKLKGNQLRQDYMENSHKDCWYKFDLQEKMWFLLLFGNKGIVKCSELLWYDMQWTWWRTWRGSWVVCRCIVWSAVERCSTPHVSVFSSASASVSLLRTVMDTSLESMETAVVGLRN